MCLFCTAIPATLALGTSFTVKKRREEREAEERGESPQETKKIPLDKVTFLAAGSLVVASAVYHSQFSA